MKTDHKNLQDELQVNESICIKGIDSFTIVLNPIGVTNEINIITRSFLIIKFITLSKDYLMMQ